MHSEHLHLAVDNFRKIQKRFEKTIATVVTFIETMVEYTSHVTPRSKSQPTDLGRTCNRKGGSRRFCNFESGRVLFGDIKIKESREKKQRKRIGEEKKLNCLYRYSRVFHEPSSL